MPLIFFKYNTSTILDAEVATFLHKNQKMNTSVVFSGKTTIKNVIVNHQNLTFDPMVIAHIALCLLQNTQFIER